MGMSNWIIGMVEDGTLCPECQGAGTVEVDHYHRQSFDVPYGDIYTTTEECDNCSGEGTIEGEEW